MEQRQRTRRRIVASALLLCPRVELVICACSFDWRIGCSRDWTATTTFGFDDTGWAGAREYDAEVVFHWGDKDDSLGTRSYDAGKWIEKVRSHRYEERGSFIAGASISYEDGAVCEGQTKEKCFELTLHDGGCDVRKLDDCSDLQPATPPTDPPTARATDRPTPEPTERPTPPPTTAAPSDRPTASPTTAEPSHDPTARPTTARPSDDPTARPMTAAPSGTTVGPTTDAPTTAPTVRSTMAWTRRPTVSPTVRPATAAPSGAPTASLPGAGDSVPMATAAARPTPVPTPSPQGGFASEGDSGTAQPSLSPPTASMAPEPTSIAPTHDKVEESPPVSCAIVLYVLGPMDIEAAQTWEDVTETAILNEAIAMTGAGKDSVVVAVQFGEQRTLSDSAVRGLSEENRYDAAPAGRSLRAPQTTSLLEIEFTTTVRFSSGGNGPDASEIVASAFQTIEKQKAYINSLKLEGGNHFEHVSRMTITVDGAKVEDTDPTVIGGANKGEGGGVGASEGGDGIGGQPHPISMLVAGAAGGAIILLCGIAVGVLYVRRNKAPGGDASSSPSAAVAAKEGGARPPPMGAVAPFDVETKSGAATNATAEQPEGFGFTIESRGEADDISTLGDPYFGDAINLQVDGNTVGESLVSSQQGLYVYGVKKQTRMGGGGTVGTSTILSGTQGFTVGVDGHLEESYQSSSPGTSTESTESSNLAQFSVVAPPGQLGIVLDNPRGDQPTIIAMKERSALMGAAIVGDYLLSVDGVDCTGMSAHALSAFLHCRSGNPQRTLVLARGSGPMNAAVTALPPLGD